MKFNSYYFYRQLRLHPFQAADGAPSKSFSFGDRVSNIHPNSPPLDFPCGVLGAYVLTALLAGRSARPMLDCPSSKSARLVCSHERCSNFFHSPNQAAISGGLDYFGRN